MKQNLRSPKAKQKVSHRICYTMAPREMEQTQILSGKRMKQQKLIEVSLSEFS